MKYKKVKEATFRSRPNRFIANVIVEGAEETVHVKNTGRCKELLYEGVRIFLEDHEENRKARKTRYSLVTVEKKDDRAKSGARLINIDSHAPNRIVGEALADGSITLPGLGFPFDRIKPEVTYGASRFDFYVEDKKGNEAYIEVKGVTLEDDGIARFPDAPTERGVKHIKELCRALDQGFAAYLIFVVQMKGITFLEPNDETHPAFGEALRKAHDKGVIILAYDCNITSDSMSIGEPVPIKL
ncbi:MAG TPA: DNA/RNA nuclease SfsA [Anaerovoracaceae bacterium]|nr:DNA/RNA nuclease SfsA [Anaerovoracaceae bacterium]